MFFTAPAMLLRITPACAGKRYTVYQRKTSAKDHPRVCGEKVELLKRSIMLKGSPPRVRGKGKAKSVQQRLHGITPACAGKSSSSFSRMSIMRDHPRVCGEKRCGRGVHSIHQGSPPRVRGKGTRHDNSNRRDRITPACAGKSNKLWLVLDCEWDHPRVCGEKTKKIP